MFLPPVTEGRPLTKTLKNVRKHLFLCYPNEDQSSVSSLTTSLDSSMVCVQTAPSLSAQTVSSTETGKVTFLSNHRWATQRDCTVCTCPVLGLVRASEAGPSFKVCTRPCWLTPCLNSHKSLKEWWGPVQQLKPDQRYLTVLVFLWLSTWVIYESWTFFYFVAYIYGAIMRDWNWKPDYIPERCLNLNHTFHFWVISC